MTTDDTEIDIFTNELLDALGAWQRGWQADEDLKKPITEKLLREAAGLPARFRAPPDVCYRKRFLFKKDMEPLIMFDGLDDGVASWSTDRAYALEFKGLVKREAVSAAYFEHRPHPDEVVVNIPALWADRGFREAAEDYRRHGGREAEAMFNFADKQSEVVLHAKLRTHEVKGMVGVSSDFDAICDQAGIEEQERDETFRKLTDDGMYFGVPRWMSEEGVQRVLATVRRNFLERHAGLIAFAAALAVIGFPSRPKQIPLESVETSPGVSLAKALAHRWSADFRFWARIPSRSTAEKPMKVFELFTVIGADPDWPGKQVETTFRIRKTTSIAGPALL